MTLTHQQIFERYLYAGAITRDPDAVADLFTEDGVYETPLIPHRLAGREAIRAGIGAFQSEPADFGDIDLSQSRYVLHETADPDTFIVEIDTVIALVWIFRVRDGRIAHLRDYFAPEVISSRS